MDPLPAHRGSVIRPHIPGPSPLDDHPAGEFQAGDIAACYATDLTSRLIRLQTGSLFFRPRIGPSHVAIIAPTQITTEGPTEFAWCESTTLCPRRCLIQDKMIDGVQMHAPRGRINDYLYHGGRVDLYRLSPLWKLSIREQQTLSQAVLCCLGHNYDMRGALLSGTRVCSRLLHPPEALSSLFCSEMLAAILMRLGVMNHSHPTHYNPARLLRELLRTDKYRLVNSYHRLNS